MKRVLVAGASGYLGRHVVKQLKDRGYWVRALMRNPRRRGVQTTQPDDIAVGDLTDMVSLGGVCDGIDVVLSCAGASMTMALFRDRTSFTEVDYLGNRNLLGRAIDASVPRFVYVSLFAGRQFLNTEYAHAHELFVTALRDSGISHAIVRPNGFFSINAENFKAAKRGRGIVIGSGNARTNPIHEADVAGQCVAAIDSPDGEILCGGPDIYTRREIVELAFEVLGKEPKISGVPAWLFRSMVSPLSLVNRRLHGLMAFGAAVSVVDMVAPVCGTRTLRSYFEELA